MNERIKQLAEKAGMTDDKFGLFFALDKHNEDGVDLVKFAELIVNECADMVAGSSLPDAYSEPVLEEIADEMREWFGVKND